MNASPRSLAARLTDGIEAFGAVTLRTIEHMGSVAILAGRTFRALITPPWDFRAIVDQIERIGIQSLPIALLTAVFSSMVMTVQFGVQMARFGAKEYVGFVVSISLARELAPVLTALMVGGRVAAGIAAELGSMNVTEQIDAIRALGADPVRKLVVPRVLACVALLPLMAAMALIVGIAAGAFIASNNIGVSANYFYRSALQRIKMSDYLGGLFKTIFFGFNIGIVACYLGINTRDGTVGVGASTTNAVVVTSVVTLILDLLLTLLLMALNLA